MSVHDWHVKTRGTEFADAFHQQQMLKIDRWQKTPAGLASLQRAALKRKAKQAQAPKAS